MPKKSDARESYFTTVFVVFIVCFAMGLAALILTGVLYTKTNTSEICANCLGIVNSVVTDNGTLSPIESQSLTFHGINGIRVGLSNPIITIDDKRWVTQYIVRPDGTGEFLTPQEAYNQAVLDGHGSDLPAVIIIGPGTYDYGNTQFQITTPGISFVALPSVVGSAGAVIFSASGLEGGIHVNISLDLTKGVLFKGITFGAISSEIGFLLNVTDGQCTLYMCGALDTNFRVVTGGGSGPFTIFGAFDCVFQTLPPNDFITTMDANTVFAIKNTQWVQLGTGATVSSGGYLFNFANGIGECRIWNSFMVFNYYNGVFQGPLAGMSGGLISVISTQIIINDAGNPVACFLRQTGSNTVFIDSSTFSLQGPLIYQTEDSVAGDNHQLSCSNSVISSKNATIANEAVVTIIGNNNYQFFNTYMKTNPDPLVINIPSATIPDVLNVIFTGVTVDTTALPLGDYAQGPGALLATIKVGTSTSISAANNAAGFSYTPLVSI
jgi:hypothetical protein